MDGSPVSYQLWNNYLLKNKNYKPEMIHKDFKQIIKSLRDKVQYAQNTLQPPSLANNSCTVMVTHILTEPDWIVIPCNQQTFGMVICQVLMNETSVNRNRPLLNKTGMKTCYGNTLPFERRCIMFRKYKQFTNFSEWKYKHDVNTLEINIMVLKFTGIFMEYFTNIQHFYIWSIQFTIPIQFTNTYLSYRPTHTEYFLKINWIQTKNSNPISKYDGYMLFSTKPASINIPSNIFQCKDGTYIDDTSVCDGIPDCIAETDEQNCYCNNSKDLLTVGCKYSYDKTSQQITCSVFYFTCLLSHKCITYAKICDGYVDCLFAEDEICENEASKKTVKITHASTFTCSESNTTIPIYLVNDLIPDCPNSMEDEIQYYSLITNPFHIQHFCNTSQELQCIYGHSHCFPINKLCIFEFHYNTTSLKHCRNGAHLHNCTHFQCSQYFKCSMSYCTPFELICDGKWDCPQGDDEINCYPFSCPNLFKCRNQTKCLHFSKICNNINECRYRDDESWCMHGNLLVCPKECKCFSQSIICSHLDKVLYYQTLISVKYFKCLSCNLEKNTNFFSSFQSIMFLNIKKYLSTLFCLNKNSNISTLISLKVLDISLNRLTTTRSFCFIPLKRLTVFHLQHNSISKIEGNSFYLLSSLQLLNLSCNNIKNLRNTAFNGLTSVRTIDLTFNLIIYVAGDTFKQVSPNTIHSYNLMVCCISGSWNKCKVKQDAFSNCDNLLSKRSMSWLCWLIGILAVFLNTVSFLIHSRKFISQRNTFPTVYLALIDCCFGIYLIIIASADLYYKGIYAGYELDMEEETFCARYLPFLPLFSMVVSPIILCLMMLARFCVIQWPISSKFTRQNIC